jgi:hypothetical protein
VGPYAEPKRAKYEADVKLNTAFRCPILVNSVRTTLPVQLDCRTVPMQGGHCEDNVLWGVMSNIMADRYRRFGGMYYLHLQSYFSTL